MRTPTLATEPWTRTRNTCSGPGSEFDTPKPPGSSGYRYDETRARPVRVFPSYRPCFVRTRAGGPSFTRVTLSQNGILRMTIPRWSTTKPVRSASAAVCCASASTARPPGTVTLGGTVSFTPPAAPGRRTETAHEPAPPPASVRSTVARRLEPTRSRPSDRVDGDAKRRGSFASGASTMPPPSRVAAASKSFAEQAAGVPVGTRAEVLCSTVQAGWRCTSSAATPATWGEAMLVPLNDADVPSRSGTDERIEAPGAETAGFMRSDTADGPDDENDAIEPDFVVAATEMAFEAVAGEPIDPRPQSSYEFPAAATGTTPASAAPSTAASTTFLAGSVSYSP